MRFLIASLLIAFSIALPLNNADQCGAVNFPEKLNKEYVPVGNADTSCVICEDLVLIAETYAECDESIVMHKMERRCEEKYQNPATRKLCTVIVDDAGHYIIEETAKNATSVCDRAIHKTC